MRGSKPLCAQINGCLEPSFFNSFNKGRKPAVGTTDRIKSAPSTADPKSSSTPKLSLNAKSPRYSGLARALRIPETWPALRPHKVTLCWLLI